MSVQAVREAINHFRAVQSEHSHFGAKDTEPDSIFQELVGKALKGDDDFSVPLTAEGWELYIGEPDVEAAAMQLHTSALGVIQRIWACTMKESKELEEYIYSVCHRL